LAAASGDDGGVTVGEDVSWATVNPAGVVAGGVRGRGVGVVVSLS